MSSKTIVTITLAIAVVAVVSSFNLSREAAPSRVGYLSINQLVSQLPEYRQQRGRLDTVIYEFNVALQSKMTEFQQKQQAYIRDSAAMNTVIKEDKLNELQNLSQSIQAFKQLSEEEVMKQDSALLQPVLNSLQEAIDQVAQEHGYTHVLNTDVSAQNGPPMVLYAEEESDITELVLAAYRKDQ